MVVADGLTALERRRLFAYAAERRLPAIYEFAWLVRDGDLMSYGPDNDESLDRVAALVVRILGGARPAELPFERPTRFELGINLTAARTIGLGFPQTLLTSPTRSSRKPPRARPGVGAAGPRGTPALAQSRALDYHPVSPKDKPGRLASGQARASSQGRLAPQARYGPRHPRPIGGATAGVALPGAIDSAVIGGGGEESVALTPVASRPLAHEKPPV